MSNTCILILLQIGHNLLLIHFSENTNCAVDTRILGWYLLSGQYLQPQDGLTHSCQQTEDCHGGAAFN